MSDTRVITKEFGYFAARSIEEAVSLLSEYGVRAKVIAGGTDLLVGIKLKRIQPDYLINIKTIAGIDRLKEYDGGLRIGTGCNFHQIENARSVKEGYTALYEAARSVSSRQIKNMGTIGGNLCNASPASDCAPALLVLGARAEIKGRGEVRQISLEELFIGPGETSLAANEILKEITIPPLGFHTGSAFLKIGRVSADLAKINVAVFVRRAGQVCKECRIALGSVAKTSLRAKGAESMLRGEQYTDSLLETVSQRVSEEIAPISDVRSTQEYRREVSKVLIKKALERAWERAEG